jgi:hypothetical protein
MEGFCTEKSTYAHGALLLLLFISGKESKAKQGTRKESKKKALVAEP